MTKNTNIKLTAFEIKKIIADFLKTKGYSSITDDITLTVDYKCGGLFTDGHYYCSGATVTIEENIKEDVNQKGDDDIWVRSVCLMS